MHLPFRVDAHGGHGVGSEAPHLIENLVYTESQYLFGLELNTGATP